MDKWIRFTLEILFQHLFRRKRASKKKKKRERKKKKKMISFMPPRVVNASFFLLFFFYLPIPVAIKPFQKDLLFLTDLAYSFASTALFILFASVYLVRSDLRQVKKIRSKRFLSFSYFQTAKKM